MNDDPQPVDPALVKYLRVLVTVLTVTMIVGFLVIIALLVIRFSDTAPKITPDAAGAPLTLPAAITLPEGARATAFTQGEDWFGVVTDQDQILIYERASGALRQTITLD